MASKKHRPSTSMTMDTYQWLRWYADQNGLRAGGVVERLLVEFLDSKGVPQDVPHQRVRPREGKRVEAERWTPFADGVAFGGGVHTFEGPT